MSALFDNIKRNTKEMLWKLTSLYQVSENKRSIKCLHRNSGLKLIALIVPYIRTLLTKPFMFSTIEYYVSISIPLKSIKFLNEPIMTVEISKKN